jgi:phage shock protein A
LAELSENPQEKLAADLDQISLDDQVSQRLQALESTPLFPLPEAHQP